MKDKSLSGSKYGYYFLPMLGACLFLSCASVEDPGFTIKSPEHKFDPPPKESTPPVFNAVKDHQIFFDVINLGFDAVTSTSFQNVIGKLPAKKKNKPIVIVKIDELPLGVKIGRLSDHDLAIENGIYKGLLSLGYSELLYRLI